MLRRLARFRRAAALMLSVHLLQVFLLAASALCESGGVPAPTTGAGVATPAEHGMQSEHVMPAEHAMHVPTAPAHDPEPVPAQHDHSTVPCPMAMACAVTAIAAPVPVITTSETRIVVLALRHEFDAPESQRLAPEPPPPRA